MYFDTHAHLLDNKFDNDRELVIQRFKNNLVEKIIEIGCEPVNWEKTLEFVSKYENMYCAIGIHPQEAKLYSDELFTNLEKICQNDKVAAIGETGLDYYHENSDRQIQLQVFKKHIDLALKLHKPIIIHCRDAYPDLKSLLQKNYSELKSFSGVVHCFSGSIEDAKYMISLGFYLGIDGPVTYPKSDMLRNIVREIPLEKILLETDCPYLPPQKYRGQRNEPAYLPIIAEEIAKVKNVPVETVAEITSRNARRLISTQAT